MWIYSLILLLITATNLEAVSVFYSKSSHAVVYIGNLDDSVLENQDLAKATIPDGSPLLRERHEFLKWDVPTQSIVKKPDAVIASIINKKEKQLKLAEIRQVRKLQSEINEMIDAGFEVEISTEDIKNKLISLTSECNSIKSKE